MSESAGRGAVRVCLETQRLILETPGQAAREWSVSTARNGAGEQLGSERTPRGRVATPRAYDHFGLSESDRRGARRAPPQADLF